MLGIFLSSFRGGGCGSDLESYSNMDFPCINVHSAQRMGTLKTLIDADKEYNNLYLLRSQ